MRKVVLRMNEQFKYETIKKLVDENGNKKRVALKLKCTVRTINRLIKVYNKKGKEGFIHGNRNRKLSCSVDNHIKALVMDLYCTKYDEANIKHFSELLERNENIPVSDTTIRNWLYEKNILSSKAKRKTKKKLKNKLKNLKKQTKSKKASTILLVESSIAK